MTTDDTGWRTAPDGKTRWWDGQAWGDELRTPAAPEPAPQQAPAEPTRKTEEPMTRQQAIRNLVKFAVGVVVLAALILWAGVSCSTQQKGTATKSSEIELTAAQSVCETATKQQLKAPDTAKFTWSTRSKTSSTTATLSGHVSSENSFGALIATNVTCRATYDASSDEVQARATLDE